MPVARMEAVAWHCGGSTDLKLPAMELKLPVRDAAPTTSLPYLYYKEGKNESFQRVMDNGKLTGYVRQKRSEFSVNVATHPFPIGFLEQESSIETLGNFKWKSRETESYLMPSPGTSSTQPLQENVCWEMLAIEEALDLLEKRDEIDLIDHLVFILKKCRRKRDLRYAERFHVHVCQFGLETHAMLGNHLVPLYVDCSNMSKAESVFCKLPGRNEFSWSSLILGYAEYGELHHALILYYKMIEDFVNPTRHTYLSMLQECSRSKCVEMGQKIYTEIAKEGFEADIYVGSTLVDMYAKCCLFAEAEYLMEELPDRNVVTWNALITGYAEHGYAEEALDCFEQLKLTNVSPSVVTYISTVKACGIIGSLARGQELHAEIIEQELETDHILGSTLLDMYSKCGLLVDAQCMFDELQLRDAVSWNALIAGYADHGFGEEALNCFEQLQSTQVCPDASTYLASLKASCSIGAMGRGQELHAEVVKEGHENDFSIGSTLIDMYSKCGLLADAQEVFDELSTKDVVSWTALIVGYVEHGLGEDALKCLEKMQSEGVSPDSVALGCCLKACGSIRAIDRGQELHAEIAVEGFDEDPFVANSLVDMYAKCGWLTEAQELFEQLSIRDVVSSSAIVEGFAQVGLGEEGVDYLQDINTEALSADNATLIACLKACGSLGVIKRGQEFHTEIIKMGKDKLSVRSSVMAYGKRVSHTPKVLLSAIVDMYGKCGSMADAHHVFERMPTRDLVAWNALMTGYAHQGESELVFSLFKSMRNEGVQPNGVTWLNLLTACTHVGQLSKGQEYFEDMGRSYSFIPTLKHHNCMVDLLGRAGQLDEAINLIKHMPVPPDLTIWSTLLSACQKWGNLEVAREAFESVVTLDKNHSAAFILMSNMCADTGLWEEAKHIKEMRLLLEAC